MIAQLQIYPTRCDHFLLPRAGCDLHEHRFPSPACAVLDSNHGDRQTFSHLPRSCPDEVKRWHTQPARQLFAGQIPPTACGADFCSYATRRLIPSTRVREVDSKTPPLSMSCIGRRRYSASRGDWRVTHGACQAPVSRSRECSFASHSREA